MSTDPRMAAMYMVPDCGVSGVASSASQLEPRYETRAVRSGPQLSTCTCAPTSSDCCGGVLAAMLTDPESVVRQKLKTMVTDPARVRRSDPGNPDVCPVGDLHKIFSTEETMAKVNEGCRSAGIGCIECKGWAADALVQVLQPMQERRKKYEDNPRLAWDILEAGSAAAGKVADATMKDVRASMGMSLEFESKRKQ